MQGLETSIQLTLLCNIASYGYKGAELMNVVMGAIWHLEVRRLYGCSKLHRSVKKDGTCASTRGTKVSGEEETAWRGARRIEL